MKRRLQAGFIDAVLVPLDRRGGGFRAFSFGLAGGAAFGFLGVMLAVPVAATVGVLTRFWLRRYLTSPIYLDRPG